MQMRAHRRCLYTYTTDVITTLGTLTAALVIKTACFSSLTCTLYFLSHDCANMKSLKTFFNSYLTPQWLLCGEQIFFFFGSVSAEVTLDFFSSLSGARREEEHAHRVQCATVNLQEQAVQ